jgi:hypothetical protein
VVCAAHATTMSSWPGSAPPAPHPLVV